MFYILSSTIKRLSVTPCLSVCLSASMSPLFMRNTVDTVQLAMHFSIFPLKVGVVKKTKMATNTWEEVMSFVADFFILLFETFPATREAYICNKVTINIFPQAGAARG